MLTAHFKINEKRFICEDLIKGEIDECKPFRRTNLGKQTMGINRRRRIRLRALRGCALNWKTLVI